MGGYTAGESKVQGGVILRITEGIAWKTGSNFLKDLTQFSLRNRLQQHS